MVTGEQETGGYHQVTVVGGGVIGISWTALFLAHGLRVTVCDPRPDIDPVVRAGLRGIAPTMSDLGLPIDALIDDPSMLRFDPAVETATATAGTSWWNR